ESASFDQAVALGAAAFAAIKQSGQKLRVKSGAARSYYIGIESNEPAIPGRRPKLQGLCVLPQGTEEGESLELPDHVLGLWTGEEVSFRLFSAPDRAGDQLGHMVRDASSELEELSPVSCRLTTAEQAAPEVLPVYLRSQLTELGTLQLAMQHQDSPQTWRLDFHLRPEHG
ncbi:MAG: Hsp70 family protein, partial [Oligoflexus sp.]